MAAPAKLVKLVTLATVVLSKPVLGKDGKQERGTATHKGRLIDIDIFDHEHVAAGKFIEVDAELSKELLSKKVARKPAAGVDYDVDAVDEDV